MDGKHDALALRNLAAEPFDLIGVDVGSRHFNGRGQVDDDAPLRRRLPNCIDRIANVDREVEFGAGKAFRAVLEDPIRPRLLLRVRQHTTCALNCNVDDAGTVQSKHHASLQSGSGVVEMHDGAPDSAQCCESLLDQLGTRLCEYLNGDVARDQILLDQRADEIEVRLRCSRKDDLDLLEARPDQQLEHAALAVRIHRFDQRLVAVPQIDAAPAGRFGNGSIRPGSICQCDLTEGTVLDTWIVQHARDS